MGETPMRPPRRVNLAAHRIPPHVVEKAEASFVKRNRVIPVTEVGETLLVASANPTARGDLKILAEHFEQSVVWVEADPADLEAAIARYYTFGASG